MAIPDKIKKAARHGSPLREPGATADIPPEVKAIQVQLRWFDRQKNKVEAAKKLKEWLEEGRKGAPDFDVGPVSGVHPAHGHRGVHAYVAEENPEGDADGS